MGKPEFGLEAFEDARRSARHPPLCASVSALLTIAVSACVLVVAPAPAGAFEVRAGVSLGGIQVGTDPRFAVSPFAGLLWRKEKSFLLEAHHMFSVVPGSRVGIYDRTAVALGYAWKTGDITVGPSLSIYSMPVCGVVICAWVVGVAPGGHAQLDWYFAEPFGVSVSGNLDWAGGSSRVLSGSSVVMITAGPIWRFGGGSK